MKRRNSAQLLSAATSSALGALLLCLLFALPAVAQISPPAELSSKRLERLSLSANSVFKDAIDSHKSLSGARLKLYVPAVGRCMISHIRRSSFSKTIVAIISEQGFESSRAPEGQYFKARAVCSQTETPVAISIIDDVLSLDFDQAFSRRFHERSNNLSFSFPSLKPIALDSTPGKFSAGECGNPAHSHSASEGGPEILASELNTAEESIRFLDFGLIADRQFYKQHKQRSAERLLEAVNALNAIYERDLRVNLEPRIIIVFRTNSPAGLDFNTPDSSILLDNLVTYTFQELRSLDLDIVHLVSGYDIFDTFGGRRVFGVAGVAYVGTACIQPFVARGVVEDAKPSLLRILLAHEVAHNLGATHGAGEGSSLFVATEGVMSPTVNSSSNFFSAFSQEQVSDHKNLFGNCFNSEPSSINLLSGGVKVRLTAKRSRGNAKNRTLVARLVGSTEQDLSGRIIELVRVSPKKQKGFVTAKLTNQRGRASFKVPNEKATYRVRFANTVVSSVTSKSLRLK